MHPSLLELLVCPACHGSLRWQIRRGGDGRVEEADAICEACGATYPTRGGIGAFLTPDLQRDDLWESVQSGLSQFLGQHPDLERSLLDSPLGALNPADRFFRGYILEERGYGEEADVAFESALSELYTAETRAAGERMAEAVVSAVADGDRPIVDIASGRGFLVERLARSLDRIVVATDFSPTALRRLGERLHRKGLGDRVSLLAVDARCTPFADSSLPLLTTYVGLENIGEPDRALTELRRVAAGSLYWIACLYDDGDPNEAAIRGLGSTLSLRSSMQRTLDTTGWAAVSIASARARAVPTPHGEIVDAGIDGIPVKETVVEWTALQLTPQISGEGR